MVPPSRPQAKPFTKREAIRVEMTPGQGDIIKLGMGADGKVDSLTYAGLKFTKMIR